MPFGGLKSSMNHNSSSSSQKLKGNFVSNLSVLIASRGQILGFEDILQGRRFTTSVRCITKTGSILRIRKEDFIKIIAKDQKSLKHLEQIKL